MQIWIVTKERTDIIHVRQVECRDEVHTEHDFESIQNEISMKVFIKNDPQLDVQNNSWKSLGVSAYMFLYNVFLTLLYF